MARIPLVEQGSLTDEQRRVYDRIVAGPRRAVVGPLRAVLHNPELAEHWQQLGALVRYGTTIPTTLKEIAILLTARRWNAQLEWQIHEGEARKAGVSDGVIDAIREARLPPFASRAEQDVYEFVREIQETGCASDATYATVLERHGTVGVVELVALVGYYTMVAMTLNAHQMELPAGTPAGRPLPVVDARGGLTACASARGDTTRPPGDSPA